MRLRAAATPALLVLTATALLSLLVGAAGGGGGGEGGGGRRGMAGVAAGEEKVRLGSSPPSCYSKCYECSPCVAVQVPTLSGGAAPAARSRPADAATASGGDAPLMTFSNYKPLGWKCQCRDRLYDP